MKMLLEKANQILSLPIVYCPKVDFLCRFSINTPEGYVCIITGEPIVPKTPEKEECTLLN